MNLDISVNNAPGTHHLVRRPNISEIIKFKLPNDRLASGSDIEIVNKKFEVAASTRRGIGREICQDSIGVVIGKRFVALIVADGFGTNGHVYSDTFVDETSVIIEMLKEKIARKIENKTLKTSALLRKAAQKTRERILRKIGVDGSGTTAIVVLITESATQAVSVGDSALYSIDGKYYTRYFDYNRINKYTQEHSEILRMPNATIDDYLEYGNIVDTHVSSDLHTLGKIESIRLDGKRGWLGASDGVTKSTFMIVDQQVSVDMILDDSFGKVGLVDISGEHDLNGILQEAKRAKEISYNLVETIDQRNRIGSLELAEEAGNHYICIPAEDDISAISFRWR